MGRLSVLLALLLAWGVLLHAASDATRRLHADEALFLTFARRAAVGGDWWLTGVLDKPPLTVYANALALHFFAVDTLPNGVLTLDAHKGEFVGRLFSVACALLGLAALWCLYRLRGFAPLAASVALLPVLLLPLWQLYGTSAFMDMPMLAFALCGWLWAERKRGLGAGAWLALSVWAKPQGVLFAPLVLVMAWLRAPRQALLALLSASLGVLALWAWDSMRPGESVFTLGAANNLLRTGSGNLDLSLFELFIVSQFLLSASLLLFRLGLFANKRNALLALWCAGYLAIHTWSGITLYERYLLPVWVLLWTLAVNVAHALLQPRPRAKRRPSFWQLGVLSLFFAQIALLVSVPLLANGYLRPLALREDYATRSFDKLADFLNALPEATVVYYHRFGWELGYYMGQWTNKRLTHYATPAHFWTDFAALDENGARVGVGLPRYWVFNEAFPPAGWAVSEQYVAGFTVFWFEQTSD